MIIRKAERRDIPAMLDIFNYEVQYGLSTFSTRLETLQERTQWYEAHNRDNHPLVVAEQDGVVAGYASLSGFRPQAAYFRTVELSVYIHPDFRRRGLATALMKAVIDPARDSEDIHNVVSVITEENGPSLALHEKFGFRRVGEIREAGWKQGRYIGVVLYELLV